MWTAVTLRRQHCAPPPASLSWPRSQQPGGTQHRYERSYSQNSIISNKKEKILKISRRKFIFQGYSIFSLINLKETTLVLQFIPVLSVGNRRNSPPPPGPRLRLPRRAWRASENGTPQLTVTSLAGRGRSPSAPPPHPALTALPGQTPRPGRLSRLSSGLRIKISLE